MAVPIFKPPTFKPLPTYQAPSWNESAIDTLQQKRAAPGLRALRGQMNRASNVSSDNPNVKRMTLRDALSGYGQGLSSVMGQAGATAAGEYGNQYAQTSENAQAKWQSEAQAASAENEWGMNIAQTQYAADLAAEDDWEAKLEKQYELKKRAERESYYFRRYHS
jgi:hypothetical protein